MLRIEEDLFDWGQAKIWILVQSQTYRKKLFS